MDQRIKKSLYDKSVDGIEYNPQIVINENIKSIKDRITFNLKKATKIDIAVSYVVWSGLSLIYEDLKKFGKDSRIIITTEGLVTDPKSLEKLNELNINVKVYHPYSINNKGFHLKSYLFEKEDITTIMIGSNNISARAFGMVHEMAVEIDSNNNGFIVDKYKKTFDDIWDDENSLELNIDFIKGYKELYKEKKEFDKTVFLLGLDDDNIKPNYMQEKALVELEEYRNTSNKGLVIAATGTGKTFLSAFDVKNANAKKILFLVHNRLILTSAIETFKRVFKDKKKLLELTSSNKDKIDNYDVIFTTDKTAYNHLYKKVGSEYFDYIIYDEAHKIGDKTLYNDLIEYFNPKFSLGITATPERTDNPKHLFEVFEYNVPYEIRLLDAMNHELVCPFTYYGLTIDDKLLQANEQFDYTELASFLDKAITKKGHYGEKLKAILFASNIEEANKISN